MLGVHSNVLNRTEDEARFSLAPQGFDNAYDRTSIELEMAYSNVMAIDSEPELYCVQDPATGTCRLWRNSDAFDIDDLELRPRDCEDANDATTKRKEQLAADR